MNRLPSYVIITPARNEAKFIELALRSVVSQTVLPLKWVIVSDGSADATDEIVARYAAPHSWIQLLRMPERTERHFAGKVHAFNAGYEQVKGLSYDVIVSMDADISFDPDYLEFLLQKLESNPELGLVGTPFKDSSMYDYRFVSIEHVSGACQVFRKECFEMIGGYTPVKGGGIDLIAVISARMKGWKTRTFTEKVCLHHRDMGTAKHGALASRYRDGVKDYALGSHPLWQFCRTLYQLTRKPYVAGGLALAAGYVVSSVRRTARPVSRELVEFRRREQMDRLKAFFAGKTLRHSSAAVSGR